MGLFFTLARHPERIGRWALRVERVLPARLARAVARFVESFAQGLAVMRQPGRLLVALAWSFPIWLSIAAGIWLTSLAFHITFPFAGSFLVTMLLVVGVAMPTPGAIGGFHAAYQIAVQTFFGAPDDRAVGAAIVLHAISFVPVTILGIVFMAQEGLTLGRARSLAAEAGRPRRRTRQAPRVRRGRQRSSESGRGSGVARRVAGGCGPMKCPYCAHLGDKVVDSRESKEGEVIRRRRECLGCGRRFTSYERIDEIPYMVVKKDGSRERFERQKLLAGLLKACEKRPVSVAALEAIADRVESALQEKPEREMSTEEVGAFVMNELRSLDKVAYVRFASVYRHFRDIGEFMTELEGPAERKGRIVKVLRIAAIGCARPGAVLSGVGRRADDSSHATDARRPRAGDLPPDGRLQRRRAGGDPQRHDHHVHL